MMIKLVLELQFGAFMKAPYAVELEVPEDIDLLELHEVILEVLEFDDEHGFDFYLSNRWARSARQPIGDPDMDCWEDPAFEQTVTSLFPLPKHRKLFYLYDHGDCWTFRVSLLRGAPTQATSDDRQYRVVAETGQRPEQYPD